MRRRCRLLAALTLALAAGASSLLRSASSVGRPSSAGLPRIAGRALPLQQQPTRPARARARILCSASEPGAPPVPETKLYPSRWLQLGYLSGLALLSDWVCFSVAAAPEMWTETYGRDPATLIDIFLFTNVVFCLLEPGVVRRFGLRVVVVGAAVLMSAGCALRSGLPFSGSVPPYAEVVLGTVFVGAAQPFFQCTPPLLSATWFGSQERALATAVAINFNQVGIATAFLVGGTMAQSAGGLAAYFDLITVLSVAVAAGAALQFRERPPTPPSKSAAKAKAASEGVDPREAEDVGFIATARALVATPGFLPPLLAFVASIGVSNVISAFVPEIMGAAGLDDQRTIDLAGAGFQAAIVLGGIVLGGYVDRTKQYKQVTLGCLVAAVFLLQPLGLSGMPHPLVIAALLGLGALVGPVQPINAELAVEVACEWLECPTRAPPPRPCPLARPRQRPRPLPAEVRAVQPPRRFQTQPTRTR